MTELQEELREQDALITRLRAQNTALRALVLELAPEPVDNGFTGMGAYAAWDRKQRRHELAQSRLKEILGDE